MPVPRAVVEQQQQEPQPAEPPAPVPADVDKTTVEANEAATKALSSVTDLIVATLKENVPQRFAEAQRLCEVAQTLIKARARRAADFKEPEVQQQGQPNYRMAVANALNNVNVVGGMVDNNFQVNAVNAGGVNWNVAQNLPMQEPVRYVDGPDGRRHRVAPPGQILFDEQGNLINEQGIVYAGHLDANALMRHMLMAFGPHAQTGVEANRARVAAEEAVELRALQDLLPKATEHWGAILERRIMALMGNMERRSNAKPDEEVRAVPPDDPRGHPPGEGDAQADQAPRVAANGVGEQGHGGAQDARPLDPVGQVAVV